jgi:hypothetical protein
MSNAPLPTKCMEVETAAHLLGTTRNKLYKKLRAENWLHTGSFKNDPKHNSPKKWAVKAGLALTQTRPRPAPFNKQVAVLYQVTLLTERGLDEIRKMNLSMEAPEAKPLTEESARAVKAASNTQAQQAADREHGRTMAQLKAWGLAN